MEMDTTSEESEKISLAACGHFKHFEQFHILRYLMSVFTTHLMLFSKRVCSKCDRGDFLHGCLYCAGIYCQPHFEEHAALENHPASLELRFATLFCFLCRRFVTDLDVEMFKVNFFTKRGMFFEAQAHGKISSDDEDRATVTPMPSSDEEEQEELEEEKGKATADFRGLKNLGTTCYMNCVIQALAHTPNYKEYFMAETHLCRKSISSCCICETTSVFKRLFDISNTAENAAGNTNPNATALNLGSLLDLIAVDAPYFSRHQQNDAHEFMLFYFNLIHDYFSDSGFQQIGDKGSVNCRCPTHEMFTCVLESDVECQKCKNVSVTTEPTFCLSLEIDLWGKEFTLESCLRAFTRVEHLGDVKLTCDPCGSRQQVTKQLRILTLPKIAVFHLKRFCHHATGEGFKIFAYISFPDEIDLTPFTTEKANPNSKPNIYKLYAVIWHYGGIQRGHYQAYVRPSNGSWFRCDDAFILSVPKRQVFSTAAYVLFYKRKEL